MTTTLAIGQPQRLPAGKFTVHVRPMPLGNSRVEVTYAMSAQLVEGLDRTFTTRSLAEAIARVLRNALTEISDRPVSGQQAVDLARAAVAQFITAQIGWLSADGSPQAGTQVAYLQDLRGWYASADEDAWASDMIRRLNADLDARARRAGVA